MHFHVAIAAALPPEVAAIVLINLSQFYLLTGLICSGGVKLGKHHSPNHGYTASIGVALKINILVCLQSFMSKAVTAIARVEVEQE